MKTNYETIEDRIIWSVRELEPGVPTYYFLNSYDVALHMGTYKAGTEFGVTALQSHAIVRHEDED